MTVLAKTQDGREEATRSPASQSTWKDCGVYLALSRDDPVKPPSVLRAVHEGMKLKKVRTKGSPLIHCERARYTCCEVAKRRKHTTLRYLTHFPMVTNLSSLFQHQTRSTHIVSSSDQRIRSYLERIVLLSSSWSLSLSASSPHDVCLSA